MKIVQLINSLEQGGAEKLVVELSNEMAKNHDVFLITFKDDAETSNRFHFPELSEKVNYINLKLNRGLKIKDIKKLYKTLKQIKPDVIHAHLYVIFHLVFFAFLNRKTRCFHTIHSDAEADCTVKKAKPIRRMIYKMNLIRPLTISEQSRKSFVNFYKLKNPALIYNGLKNPVRSEKAEQVVEEIKGLKNSNEDKIFIHVGRFDTDAKNQDMLVDVFNQLIDEGKKLILLVVGAQYDSEEARPVTTKANKNIHFLGSKNNVADYLFASDAFCLSSKYEGMPISLFEALACGCVPICTPVGGITDVIDDGINGYLSEGTDNKSYYEAVKRFLKKPEAINGHQLTTYFNQNFTIQKCVSRHINLYTN